MLLLISTSSYQLQNGKYRGTFSISECSESDATEIPFDLGKEDLFDTEEEALKAAHKAVITTIHKRYPEGTKYKMRNS